MTTSPLLAALVGVALCAACSDTAPASTLDPPPATLDVGNGTTIAVLGSDESPYVTVDGPIAVHSPYSVCSNDDSPAPPVDCGSTANLIEGRLLVVGDCAYVSNASGEYVVVFQTGTRWDGERARVR